MYFSKDSQGNPINLINATQQMHNKLKDRSKANYITVEAVEGDRVLDLERINDTTANARVIDQTTYRNNIKSFHGSFTEAPNRSGIMAKNINFGPTGMAYNDNTGIVAGFVNNGPVVTFVDINSATQDDFRKVLPGYEITMTGVTGVGGNADIVVVFDNTQTMAMYNRHLGVADGIKSIMDNLAANDVASRTTAILEYRDDFIQFYKPWTPPGTMLLSAFNSNSDTIRDAIIGLQAFSTGNQEFHMEALNQVSLSTTLVGFRSNPADSHSRYAILVTDESGDDDHRYEEVVQKLKNAGVIVLGLFFGTASQPSQSLALLSKLCHETGGVVSTFLNPSWPTIFYNHIQERSRRKTRGNVTIQNIIENGVNHLSRLVSPKVIYKSGVRDSFKGLELDINSFSQIPSIIPPADNNDNTIEYFLRNQTINVHGQDYINGGTNRHDVCVRHSRQLFLDFYNGNTVSGTIPLPSLGIVKVTIKKSGVVSAIDKDGVIHSNIGTVTLPQAKNNYVEVKFAIYSSLSKVTYLRATPRVIDGSGGVRDWYIHETIKAIYPNSTVIHSIEDIRAYKSMGPYVVYDDKLLLDNIRYRNLMFPCWDRGSVHSNHSWFTTASSNTAESTRLAEPVLYDYNANKITLKAGVLTSAMNQLPAKIEFSKPLNKVTLLRKSESNFVEYTTGGYSASNLPPILVNDTFMRDITIDLENKSFNTITNTNRVSLINEYQLSADVAAIEYEFDIEGPSTNQVENISATVNMQRNCITDNSKLLDWTLEPTNNYYMIRHSGRNFPVWSAAMARHDGSLYAFCQTRNHASNAYYLIYGKVNQVIDGVCILDENSYMYSKLETGSSAILIRDFKIDDSMNAHIVYELASTYTLTADNLANFNSSGQHTGGTSTRTQTPRSYGVNQTGFSCRPMFYCFISASTTDIIVERVRTQQGPTSAGILRRISKAQADSLDFNIVHQNITVPNQRYSGGGIWFTGDPLTWGLIQVSNYLEMSVVDGKALIKVRAVFGGYYRYSKLDATDLAHSNDDNYWYEMSTVNIYYDLEDKIIKNQDDKMYDALEAANLAPDFIPVTRSQYGFRTSNILISGTESFEVSPEVSRKLKSDLYVSALGWQTKKVLELSEGINKVKVVAKQDSIKILVNSTVVEDSVYGDAPLLNSNRDFKVVYFNGHIENSVEFLDEGKLFYKTHVDTAISNPTIKALNLTGTDITNTGIIKPSVSPQFSLDDIDTNELNIISMQSNNFLDTIHPILEGKNPSGLVSVNSRGNSSVTDKAYPIMFGMGIRTTEVQTVVLEFDAKILTSMEGFDYNFSPLVVVPVLNLEAILDIQVCGHTYRVPVSIRPDDIYRPIKIEYNVSTAQVKRILEGVEQSFSPIGSKSLSSIETISVKISTLKNIPAYLNSIAKTVVRGIQVYGRTSSTGRVEIIVPNRGEINELTKCIFTEYEVIDRPSSNDLVISALKTRLQNAYDNVTNYTSGYPATSHSQIVWPVSEATNPHIRLTYGYSYTGILFNEALNKWQDVPRATMSSIYYPVRPLAKHEYTNFSRAYQYKSNRGVVHTVGSYTVTGTVKSNKLKSYYWSKYFTPLDVFGENVLFEEVLAKRTNESIMGNSTMVKDIHNIICAGVLLPQSKYRNYLTFSLPGKQATSKSYSFLWLNTSEELKLSFDYSKSTNANTSVSASLFIGKDEFLLSIKPEKVEVTISRETNEVKVVANGTTVHTVSKDLSEDTEVTLSFNMKSTSSTPSNADFTIYYIHIDGDVMQYNPSYTDEHYLKTPLTTVQDAFGDTAIPLRRLSPGITQYSTVGLSSTVNCKAVNFFEDGVIKTLLAVEDGDNASHAIIDAIVSKDKGKMYNYEFVLDAQADPQDIEWVNGLDVCKKVKIKLVNRNLNVSPGRHTYRIKFYNVEDSSVLNNISYNLGQLWMDYYIDGVKVESIKLANDTDLNSQDGLTYLYDLGFRFWDTLYDDRISGEWGRSYYSGNTLRYLAGSHTGTWDGDMSTLYANIEVALESNSKVVIEKACLVDNEDKALWRTNLVTPSLSEIKADGRNLDFYLLLDNDKIQFKNVSKSVVKEMNALFQEADKYNMNVRVALYTFVDGLESIGIDGNRGSHEPQWMTSYEDFLGAVYGIEVVDPGVSVSECEMFGTIDTMANIIPANSPSDNYRMMYLYSGSLMKDYPVNIQLIPDGGSFREVKTIDIDSIDHVTTKFIENDIHFNIAFNQNYNSRHMMYGVFYRMVTKRDLVPNKHSKVYAFSRNTVSASVNANHQDPAGPTNNEGVVHYTNLSKLMGIPQYSLISQITDEVHDSSLEYGSLAKIASFNLVKHILVNSSTPDNREILFCDADRFSVTGMRSHRFREFPLLYKEPMFNLNSSSNDYKGVYTQVFSTPIINAMSTIGKTGDMTSIHETYKVIDRYAADNLVRTNENFDVFYRKNRANDKDIRNYVHVFISVKPQELNLVGQEEKEAIKQILMNCKIGDYFSLGYMDKLPGKTATHEDNLNAGTVIGQTCIYNEKRRGQLINLVDVFNIYTTNTDDLATQLSNYTTAFRAKFLGTEVKPNSAFRRGSILYRDIKVLNFILGNYEGTTSPLTVLGGKVSMMFSPGMDTGNVPNTVLVDISETQSNGHIIAGADVLAETFSTKSEYALNVINLAFDNFNARRSSKGHLALNLRTTSPDVVAEALLQRVVTNDLNNQGTVITFVGYAKETNANQLYDVAFMIYGRLYGIKLTDEELKYTIYIRNDKTKTVFSDSQLVGPRDIYFDAFCEPEDNADIDLIKSAPVAILDYYGNYEISTTSPQMFFAYAKDESIVIDRIEFPTGYVKPPIYEVPPTRKAVTILPDGSPDVLLSGSNDSFPTPIGASTRMGSGGKVSAPGSSTPSQPPATDSEWGEWTEVTELENELKKDNPTDFPEGYDKWREEEGNPSDPDRGPITDSEGTPLPPKPDNDGWPEAPKPPVVKEKRVKLVYSDIHEHLLLQPTARIDLTTITTQNFMKPYISADGDILASEVYGSGYKVLSYFAEDDYTFVGQSPYNPFDFGAHLDRPLDDGDIGDIKVRISGASSRFYITGGYDGQYFSGTKEKEIILSAKTGKTPLIYDNELFVSLKNIYDESFDGNTDTLTYYTTVDSSDVELDWNRVDDILLFGSSTDISTSLIHKYKLTDQRPEVTVRLKELVDLFPDENYDFRINIISYDGKVLINDMDGGEYQDFYFDGDEDYSFTIKANDSVRYIPWNKELDEEFEGVVNGKVPYLKPLDGKSDMIAKLPKIDLPEGARSLEVRAVITESEDNKVVTTRYDNEIRPGVSGVNEDNVYFSSVSTINQDFYSPWRGISLVSERYKVDTALKTFVMLRLFNPALQMSTNSVVEDIKVNLTADNPNIKILNFPEEIEFEEGEDYKDIKVEFKATAGATSNWHPKIHNGYYYINNHEYFLYANESPLGERKITEQYVEKDVVLTVEAIMKHDGDNDTITLNDASQEDFSKGVSDGVRYVVDGIECEAITSTPHYTEYATTGTYQSEVISLSGVPSKYGAMTWLENKPKDTTVNVFIRSFIEHFDQWSDWVSVRNDMVPGVPLSDKVQYRIHLSSASKTSVIPVVNVDSTYHDFYNEEAVYTNISITNDKLEGINKEVTATFVSKVLDYGSTVSQFNISSRGTGEYVITAASSNSLDEIKNSTTWKAVELVDLNKRYYRYKVELSPGAEVFEVARDARATSSEASTPKVSDIKMSFVFDGGAHGVVLERPMVANLPMDSQWHTITDNNLSAVIYPEIISSGYKLSDLLMVRVKSRHGIEFDYDILGLSKLRAKSLQEEMELRPSDYFNFVDGECRITPIPQQFAPVIVVDEEAGELTRVNFTDIDGKPSLVFKEVIKGKDRKGLQLTHTNIDLGTLKVEIGDKALEDKDYKVYNNILYLSEKLDPKAEAHVSYRINNSFCVDYNYDVQNDTALITTHTSSQLEKTSVFYECDKDRSDKIPDDVNVNTIYCPDNYGFLYVSNEINTCTNLQVNANPTTLIANGKDCTNVYIRALDDLNNPVAGDMMIIESKYGKLVLKDNISDKYGVVVCQYIAGTNPGIDTITITDVDANIIKTLEIVLKEDK